MPLRQAAAQPARQRKKVAVFVYSFVPYGNFAQIKSFTTETQRTQSKGKKQKTFESENLALVVTVAAVLQLIP